MVFDSAHQHIFAAVADLSRVEVFSSVTHTRVASIEVPNAISVDLSPDGTRIAVGTGTQYIYLINTATLSVVDRVAFRGVGGPIYPYFMPNDVIYMSNGKALVRANEGASTTGIDLVEWDLSTNTFRLRPDLPQDVAGFVARSGDYSKLVIGSLTSEGDITLYDATSDSVTHTSYFDSYTYHGAANPNGTQFAVYAWNPDEWSRVIILDSNLNEIGYLDGYSNVSGLTYSLDGRYLYVSDQSSRIDVVDTQSLRSIGKLADALIGDVSHGTWIEGIDSTGTIFGASNQGVTFIGASTPRAISSPYPILIFPQVVSPATGSMSSSTPVTIFGRDFVGATVYFGAKQGSIGDQNSSMINATAPSSSVAGPVNVSLAFANGSIGIAPDGFSYGPYIYAVLATAGSSAGGQSLEILGYGFGTSDPLTVTIGGASASVTKRSDAASTTLRYFSDYNYPLPLQSIEITTPPGAPGWADLTVTTPYGSTTLKKAFNYLTKSFNFIKSSNLSNPTYDRFRDRVYVSNGGQVEVFDLTTQSWLPPLLPPAGAGSSDLHGMALTPDGSRLLVTDFGTSMFHVIDLNGAAGFSIDLSAFSYNSYKSGQVVWANGRPYVATVTGGGSGGSMLLEVDLAGRTAKPVSYGNVLPCGDPHLAASADGTRMFVAFGNCAAGDTMEFDFVSGQIYHQPFNWYLYDAAVSADGNLFSTGGGNAGGAWLAPSIVDSDLFLTSRPQRPEYYSMSFGLAPGQTFHPTGALLYEPSPQSVSGGATQDYIDVLDAHRGDLRQRVIVRSDLLREGYGSDRVLSTDDTGKRLFAVTDTGLSVFEFAEMPLAIGAVYPREISPNAGTPLTIRGSGFKTGAKVKINGQILSATLDGREHAHPQRPHTSPGQALRDCRQS